MATRPPRGRLRPRQPPPPLPLPADEKRPVLPSPEPPTTTTTSRDTRAATDRTPGIQTLIFHRSPTMDSRLDPATPEFIPGVPIRQRFQEPAPECGVRPGITFADAARSPPLGPASTTPSPPPGTHTRHESRPTPVSRPTAGHTPVGARAGPDEIKIGEIREGHKITFPLPILKKIVCNLCRPQSPGNGKNQSTGTPLNTCWTRTTTG
ncbi:hypothetical protein EGW08_017537 [Elysia chlorotica]|uniref:Uncharacterized protein n=1 Tax=Elysia chlorotica TaxID=188477 RepID=A0A3S1BTT7_ELYCH|nr:hypothetical protein EGW08_017537 [Elysia chlorotica]